MSQSPIVEEPLGMYLRSLREQRGINLTQMASQLRFSKSHISNVEKGVQHPSDTLLRGYEMVLSLPPDHLVELWLAKGETLRHTASRVPLVSDLPAPNSSASPRVHAIGNQAILRDIDFSTVERYVTDDRGKEALSEAQRAVFRETASFANASQATDQTSAGSQSITVLPSRKSGGNQPDDSEELDRRAQLYLSQVDNLNYLEVVEVFNLEYGMDIKEGMMLRPRSIYWRLCGRVLDQVIDDALREKKLRADDELRARNRCVSSLLTELSQYQGECMFLTWLTVLFAQAIYGVEWDTLVVDSTVEYLSHSDPNDDRLRKGVIDYASSRPDRNRTFFIVQLAIHNGLQLPTRLAQTMQITDEIIRERLTEFYKIYLEPNHLLEIRPAMI